MWLTSGSFLYYFQINHIGMCNLDAVYEGVTNGRDVYIIDDDEGYAIKYSSKHIGFVMLKTRGSTPKRFPSSDEDVFASTLAGRIVTEREYNFF